MVKILFKLLLIACLFINLTSHAATTADNQKSVESKFDQNSFNFSDDVATYIVYFGSDLKSTKSKSNSFIGQKSDSSLTTKNQQQQQRVSSHRTDILEEIAAEEYQVIRSYKAIPTIVIRTSEKVIKQLAKSPLVQKIGVDNSSGNGHLNDAIPQTNIDLVKALPLSGTDIEVAIIDSGLDQDHPDFVNRIATQVCFSNDCDASIYDQNGHGTNVAGIIAGAGGLAPQGGAPDVTLHILKILNANNKFDSSTQIVSALDHIITELPNVTIINMSIGTSQLFQSTCDDSTSWTKSLANAVNQLNARGVTLFASSGNDSDNTAISAPACLSNVIAVGATWDNGISSYNGFCNEPSPAAGEITCFSNSSNNVDIVAPGAWLTATGRNHGVSSYAGTSMASPLVASCAVLLRQAVPSLTPNELRSALTANGGTNVTDSVGRDFPSLDCWQSYQALPKDEPPVLTRLSPQASLTTIHPDLQFTVNAQDDEDGDISSQVTWWLDDVNTGSTGASFEHIFAIGGYTITAKVVDSALNETTLTWNLLIVSLPNPPPEIIINSPDNDSQYDNGQMVNFVATATDQNDGDISADIQWLLNDGVISQGANFNQTFNVGFYTVIARVANSVQSISQAEVSFTVNEAVVTLPEITINTPSNNGQYNEAETVNFTASATDQIDGDISGNIQWLLNSEVISQGENFSQTFSSGSYTIVAIVENSKQGSSQTEVTFIVISPPVIGEPSSGSSSGGGSMSISLLLLLLLRFVAYQYYSRRL